MAIRWHSIGFVCLALVGCDGDGDSPATTSYVLGLSLGPDLSPLAFVVDVEGLAIDTREYLTVEFDAEGNFMLDMGQVAVPDIEAHLVLTGHPVEPDAMCGEVEGMLMSPLEFDLSGSTFAAIPLVGGCEADLFPSPIPHNCSML